MDLKHVHELVGARRPDEALQRLQALIERTSNDPRLWRVRGQILLQKQQTEAGLASLKYAAECAGRDAEYWVEYGHCLARLGQRRAALDIARLITGMILNRPNLYDALGTLFTFCEEATEALPYFEAAVATEPTNVGFRYNLATVQRMSGEFAEAERNLDQVIDAHPDDYAAYLTRSDLRRQTPARNHVESMERVISTLSDPRRGLSIFFAIAKELEDLGEYERSFSYLKRGCDTQRQQMVYSVRDDVMVLERITERHTSHSLAIGLTGDRSREPIFILGLPRSGTTLVERIIASHPDVTQRGELNAFPLEIAKAVQISAARPVPKEEFVDLSLKVDPTALGRAYLEAARPQGGPQGRFTDKLPLNYLYAGLICRALPNARIIALRRGAMDSCYAMYKALFTSAYPFTYDLLDVARYYVAWSKLMDHWASVLGDAWLTVKYEDVVTSQEAVTRRMIRHCELNWDERCLDFYKQHGAVSTASAVQVRRRINSDSIGRWRHYGEQLTAVQQYLLEHGIPLD